MPRSKNSKKKLNQKGVPLEVLWDSGKVKSLQVDDSIVRKKDMKFTIAPLCLDTIVCILSFIFTPNAPYIHFNKLHIFEKYYVEMLLAFSYGKDWTNYEMNCLGRCQLPENGVVFIPREPKKKRLVLNSFAEYELESSDNEKDEKSFCDYRKDPKMYKKMRIENVKDILLEIDEDY
jgi:hypothetical protein